MFKQFIKQNQYLEYFFRKLNSYIPYGKRKFDKYFSEFTHILIENEKKSIEEVKEYQFNELKKIVNIAYNHTKFYRMKYDNANFNPTDLHTIEDIEKIPLLTKDEIRNHNLEMIDDRLDIKKLIKGVTSGTTGKALELYADKKTMSREYASISYQWKRVGFMPGDGKVEFRGFIEDDRDYIHFPDNNILRINIIKINVKNINKIIKKINQLNYKFIHGYPSAIYKFAKILQNQKIDYTPKAIMMASEVLYDWQMNLIDNVFDCPKIIHYGQAEKAALGAWTRERKYSFIPSYGIVELDKNSKELIATSLINEAMPLIRYRLTDTVENFSDEPIDSKKALFPVIENINGREEDYTYDENNNLIPPAVVTFPFKQLKCIDAAKIIQNSINNFELVLETKFDAKDENLGKEVEKMILNFQKLYGKSAKFTINFTNNIPLGANGKFRWIECRIK